MTYIDWFNRRRLPGEITNDTSYTTPAEFEAAHYKQKPDSHRGCHPITRAVVKPGAYHYEGQRDSSTCGRLVGATKSRISRGSWHQAGQVRLVTEPFVPDQRSKQGELEEVLLESRRSDPNA
jgi:hypothetical protein